MFGQNLPNHEKADPSPSSLSASNAINIKEASATSLYLWTQKTSDVGEKLARLHQANDALTERMSAPSTQDPATKQAMVLTLNNLWALQWMIGDANFLQTYWKYLKVRYGRTPDTCLDEELSGTIQRMLEWGLYDQLIDLIRHQIEIRSNHSPKGFINDLRERLAQAYLGNADYDGFLQTASKSNPLYKTVETLKKEKLKVPLASHPGTRRNLSAQGEIPTTVYIYSDKLYHANPQSLSPKALANPLVQALIRQNDDAVLSLFKGSNDLYDYLSGGAFHFKVQKVVFHPPKSFDGSEEKPRNALELLASSEIRDHGQSGMIVILGYGKDFQSLAPTHSSDYFIAGDDLGNGVIFVALDSASDPSTLADPSTITARITHESLHELGMQHTNTPGQKGPYDLLNEWKQRQPNDDEPLLLDAGPGTPLMGIKTGLDPENFFNLGWKPVTAVKMADLLKEAGDLSRRLGDTPHYLRSGS